MNFVSFYSKNKLKQRIEKVYRLVCWEPFKDLNSYNYYVESKNVLLLFYIVYFHLQNLNRKSNFVAWHRKPLII